jgi:S-formylglutathione hydrolase
MIGCASTHSIWLNILTDVGDADPFIENELRPELVERACAAAGNPLTLRR